MSDVPTDDPSIHAVINTYCSALERRAAKPCAGPDEVRATTACDCASCDAKRALADAAGWRFAPRSPSNARQRAIAEAWEAHCTRKIAPPSPYSLVKTRPIDPDRVLQHILCGNAPTSQDWRTATAVIQWLSTPGGEAMLAAAGLLDSRPNRATAGDEIRVVAGLAVHRTSRDAPALVLMGLRRSDRRRPGMWEFPGGKVEPGETAPQALQREWREELGVAVTCGAHIADAHLHVEAALDITLQHVTIDLGEGPASLDHREIAWVHLDEVIQRRPCVPTVYLFYRAIREFLDQRRDLR